MYQVFPLDSYRGNCPALQTADQDSTPPQIPRSDCNALVGHTLAPNGRSESPCLQGPSRQPCLLSPSIRCSQGLRDDESSLRALTFQATSRVSSSKGLSKTYDCHTNRLRQSAGYGNQSSDSRRPPIDLPTSQQQQGANWLGIRPEPRCFRPNAAQGDCTLAPLGPSLQCEGSRPAVRGVSKVVRPTVEEPRNRQRTGQRFKTSRGENRQQEKSPVSKRARKREEKNKPLMDQVGQRLTFRAYNLPYTIIATTLYRVLHGRNGRRAGHDRGPRCKTKPSKKTQS